MPFFRNIKSEIDLIVDISSHSVAVALVVFSKNRPKIIFSDRSYLPIRKIESRSQLENSILERLDRILEKTIKEGAHKLHIKYNEFEGKKVNKILCLMAAPWTTAETTIHKKESPKKNQITEKMIDDLLKAESVTRNEAENGTHSFALEKIVIKTKLNGYTTKNPIGKKAKDIEILTFESRADLDWLERVEKIIYRRFHRESIFHSHVLSTFMALEEIFPKNKNYLLAEITGETTEITLVEDGVIKKSSCFGIGKNIFLRDIGNKFNVEAEIALSFLKLYNEKRAEQKFSNTIREIIKKTEDSWKGGFLNALSELKTKPSTIFLSTDPFFASFFENYIKNTAEDPPGYKVFKLSAPTFGDFIEPGENNYDPIISLGVLFLKKIHN